MIKTVVKQQGVHMFFEKFTNNRHEKDGFVV